MASRRTDPHLDARQLLSIGLVVIGVLLLLEQVGLPIADSFVWPAVLTSVGVAVIWRQLDEEQERRLKELANRLPGRPLDALGSDRAAWTRMGVGALFVIAGMGSLLAVADALPALRQGVIALGVLVLGFTLIFGPWWVRLGRDLATERRERIRSEERATMAAHLHDSVLQTLALIQKASESPAEVERLARRQERELRDWLFAPTAAAGSLQHAVRSALDDLEDRHPVRFELVSVGDAPVDDRLAEMVPAIVEAARNAAKHAGVETVDVYVEVTDDRLSAFVRDRGEGFDRAAVPEDRRGVRDSIEHRIRRLGGRVRLDSAPGSGTEVELEVPRR